MVVRGPGGRCWTASGAPVRSAEQEDHHEGEQDDADGHGEEGPSVGLHGGHRTGAATRCPGACKDAAMATKFCMQCSGEFIDTVEVCPDCDLELVAERPDGELDAGADGQVQYELHEWAVESRVMLEQLLEAAGIRRAWSGTDLI